jgi:hypothetical protein
MSNTSLTPELVKLTTELASAFAQCQKVVSANARIRLFYQNPEATDLFRKVNEYGEELRNKHMAGMPPSEEEIAKFDIEALASVLKTVYLRKEIRLAEGKKVMASDEKVMQPAAKKLFEEMSFVLNRSVGELEKDFYGRLVPERDELLAQLD